MISLRKILTLLSLVSLTLSAAAQADRHEVRAGNRRFRKGNYAEAGIRYRKALLQDSTSFAARYNLANSLYREEDIDAAGQELDHLKAVAPDSPHGADYYYNVGDVALRKQDYGAAVEAFRQSLLRRPDDVDAKENYIYARKMLQDQQGGGGGDGEQQDQQDNQQDQQNQQDGQDGQQDPDRQDRPREEPQPQGGLTAQQAQQMLEAVQAKEKETQDKVNKEKAALVRSRQKDKNW